MDGGLLVQIGVVVALLLVLWLLPGWDQHRDRARRLGRVLGIVHDGPPRPTGPAIEQIASDAQRIRDAIRHAPPGMPVARMRGWLEAYDDVLVAACHALEIDQRLESLPEGTDRDLERTRVERLLVRAGLLDGSQR